MPRPVDDATLGVLRQALTRASRTAAVVSSNLANVDTPGYRALEVRFSDALAEASALGIERSDRRHLGPSDGRMDEGLIVEAPILRMRNDGNTVDVDREMTAMAAAMGRYQAAAEMVRKRFGLRIYAATDGRQGG